MAAEIGEGFGWIAGSLIGLLTLLIPLGSVLIDRGDRFSERPLDQAPSTTLSSTTTPGTAKPPAAAAAP